MENKISASLTLAGVLIAGSATAATSFTDALDSTSLSSNFEIVIPDGPETIDFTATGAEFGNTDNGFGGRNYLMTIQDDFASADFTAEITIDRGVQANNPTNNSRFFFGLGEAGDGAFNRPADGDGIDFTVVYADMQDNFGNFSERTGVSGDGTGAGTDEVDFTGMSTVLGTMRVRMDFDATAETISYSIDYGFSGGTFVADQSFGAIDVSAQTALWATERSSIFFGGGGGNLNAYDFAVTVPEPSAFALIFGGAACGLALVRRRRA